MVVEIHAQRTWRIAVRRIREEAVDGVSIVAEVTRAYLWTAMGRVDRSNHRLCCRVGAAEEFLCELRLSGWDTALVHRGITV